MDQIVQRTEGMYCCCGVFRPLHESTVSLWFVILFMF